MRAPARMGGHRTNRQAPLSYRHSHATSRIVNCAMRESSHRQQCVSAKAPEISGIRSDHQPGTEGSVRFAQSSLPVLKYLPSKDAPDSVLISTPDSDSLIEVSSPGGIRLLDALQGGLTLDAAVQSVAGTLALPQEAVRRASESLVTELRRTGILSSQAQPVTGRRVIASLGDAMTR